MYNRVIQYNIINNITYNITNNKFYYDLDGSYWQGPGMPGLTLFTPQVRCAEAEWTELLDKLKKV